MTRFLFRSRYLYDIDSVNFALAIRRFDPRVYQPHPPGYFLYIGLGRLFNSLLRDANLALVVLSIAASCGTVILIYRMALSWFGWRSARFAGLLFLLSPLAWFHGTVALTYSVEAFFSALLGYLCWLIAGGRVSLVVPAAIALGVSAGVRPSSLLFLGPLFVFSLRKVSAKRRGAGVAALALALAAWFLPMIRASGGFHAYFEALLSLWRLVPSKDTVFNSSPATSIARACTIVFIYLLTFGAASLAPLAALRRRPGDSEKKLFTAVWMGPALCFFTLIFLKFVNSGYLLLLATPASIWLGRWASDWYETTAWRKDWKLAALGMGAAANVLIFLAAPVYCSYRSVRRFEAQLSGIRAALPQVASPKDTLLIGFDSHFLGYRHAGYYLPSYLTVQYPEVKLIEGVRIFALEDRDTRLLTGLPLSTYSKFVLFPLPGEAASYRQYLDQVKSRLGEHRLRTIDAGGYQFLTGPITDLPLLFPPAAPGQKPGVYVVLHSGAQPVNSRAHQSAPAAF
ncbi:MAG TPA: DUF2723 domain-containing protein [Acidobacteriaceae bacterium]|nr:DUF2723 domain-containing protein [Acidobacteriaceae bacterium]